MENYNNAVELWDKALTKIKSEVSQISYDMFIKKLEPVDIVGDKFLLRTDLDKTKKSVDKDFLEKINDAVKSYNGYVKQVEIIVGNKPIVKKTEENIAKIKVIGKEESTLFNKDYTFDNFVVGNSNNIVFAAALAVAEEPGSKVNPLFIYGGVGLGKTHIMHAIANKIRENDPDKRILYSTTFKFTEDYINSIKNTRDNRLIEEFTKKYRDVDILMLDDIQFLSGKQATQETLFHLFNELLLKNKQVIFTSDRHPKELTDLEERMRSRFLSGITLDIGYPDLETRIAILQKKAYQNKYCIREEILEYIASKIDTNIRELEGALKKVIFLCSLNKAEPTIDIVNKALKDDIESKNGPITMDIVTDKVCEFFNINKSDILSKKKTKNIVEARQIAIYMISDMISVPLTAIGEYFGGRDHSTVIHARDKITELKSANIIYKNYINDITEMIRKQ